MNQNVDLLACPNVDPAQVLAFFSVTLISCLCASLPAVLPSASLPNPLSTSLLIFFFYLKPFYFIFCVCKRERMWACMCHMHLWRAEDTWQLPVYHLAPCQGSVCLVAGAVLMLQGSWPGSFWSILLSPLSSLL